MGASNKPGWLLFLAPALLCLPCLLVGLGIAGGAVLLSGLGGFLTRNLWLVLGILVVGGGLAAGLYLRRRREPTDACCLPDAVFPSSQRPTANQSDVTGPADERRARADVQGRG